MEIAQVNISGFLGDFPGLQFSTNTSIGDFVGRIIPYLFAGAGFLLLIYLVIGGLEFMLSLGDPKKTAGARGKITSALIGFLIVFAAYIIVQVIGLIFKIEAINSIFS